MMSNMADKCIAAMEALVPPSDRAPPMIPGDITSDNQYLEEQGVHAAIRLALDLVIREKPANGLARIAELISPETFRTP